MRGLRLDVVGLADSILLVTRSNVSDLENALVARHVLAAAGITAGQLQLVVNGHRPGPDPTPREIGRAVRLPVAATLPSRDDPGWTEAITTLVDAIQR